MLKKNKIIISLLIAMMLLASYGCAKATKKPVKPITGTPQSTTGNVTTPSGTTTTTPPGTTMTVAPPKELISLESYAIKIMTDINSKKWKTAGKKFTSIKAELAKVSSKLSSVGVQDATVNNIAMSVDNLKRDLTAKKVFEAKVDANELTRYIADAMGS
jgi:hypothetical protein